MGQRQCCQGYNYSELPLSNGQKQTSARRVTPRRELSEKEEFVQTSEEEVVQMRQRFSARAASFDPERYRDPKSPAVQFAASSYYCLDNEPVVRLEVIRLGDLNRTSNVSYRTEDVSAFAGEAYVAQSGRLDFRPGDYVKSIDIDILNDEFWNATLEFKIILLEEDIVGATLVDYMFESNVKKVDTSKFPSDKFADLDLAQVRPRALLMDFYSFVWKMPLVRKGTLSCIAVDTFHNCVYFMNLFMYVYLINDVIRMDRELFDLFVIKDRETLLICYAGFSVGSLALLHIMDYWKLQTKEVGTARSFLQGAIVRKYFNYTTHVRGGINDGDILKAVDRDAPAIAESYSGFLHIFRVIGELLCMLLFKLVSPYIFGTSIDISAIVPLLLFPLVLGTVIVLREPSLRIVLTRANSAENLVTDQVDLVTDNYDLVLDYDTRSAAADMFDDTVKKHRATRGDVEKVLLNTHYFTKWVTTVIVAGYIWFGGRGVIESQLTVGMFVTNLSIFANCGKGFDAILSIIVEMQQAYPSIMKLYELLNLKTDNDNQIRSERATRAMTAKWKEKVLRETNNQDNVILEDQIPIEVKLSNNFNFEGHRTSQFRSLNFNGNLEIPQGNLVAIFGAIGSGKTTLLKLIGGRLFPDANWLAEDKGINIPPHLRRVTVQTNPMFYHGTLLENLTFGAAGHHSDRARLISICQKLGLSENCYSGLDNQLDYEDPPYSEAECKLLNIARALFFNAEITCFHKPLQKLDMDRSRLVMQVFHEHIHQKGLVLPEDVLRRRRPRTIFLTSSNPIAILEADFIYRVDNLDGLSEVTSDMADQLLKNSFAERQTNQVESNRKKASMAAESNAPESNRTPTYVSESNAVG